MEVSQVSNPTGLKRLFNNLLEASACSQGALAVEEEEQKILLSHGEDELSWVFIPIPGGGDTAEALGRDGMLGHRDAAPESPSEQRSPPG